MKKRIPISLAIATVLFLGIAGTSHAGSGGVPNENGCGMGSFTWVRLGFQQQPYWHRPPPFTRVEFDQDGKPEGRSDGVPMMLHEECVAELGQ